MKKLTKNLAAIAAISLLCTTFAFSQSKKPMQGRPRQFSEQGQNRNMGRPQQNCNCTCANCQANAKPSKKQGKQEDDSNSITGVIHSVDISEGKIQIVTAEKEMSEIKLLYTTKYFNQNKKSVTPSKLEKGSFVKIKLAKSEDGMLAADTVLVKAK